MVNYPKFSMSRSLNLQPKHGCQLRGRAVPDRPHAEQFRSFHKLLIIINLQSLLGTYPCPLQGSLIDFRLGLSVPDLI